LLETKITLNQVVQVDVAEIVGGMDRQAEGEELVVDAKM